MRVRSLLSLGLRPLYVGRGSQQVMNRQVNISGVKEYSRSASRALAGFGLMDSACRACYTSMWLRICWDMARNECASCCTLTLTLMVLASKVQEILGGYHGIMGLSSSDSKVDVTWFAQYGNLI